VEEEERMRLTKEQAAQNRRDILEAAGKLFRERGFEGVGIADLMKAAGFTHGGFYNHFPSKQALAAEMCAEAFQRTNSQLAEDLKQAPDKALKAFLEHYVSAEHRDDPAQGCTLAALAADTGRQPPEVQETVAKGLEEVIQLIAAHLPPSTSEPRTAGKASPRERAIQLMSEAVGGLILARAVGAANPEFSDEILEANVRKLIKL
jgi:TetR/AcrR family transcriptional repressor of nem operon